MYLVNGKHTTGPVGACIEHLFLASQQDQSWDRSLHNCVICEHWNLLRVLVTTASGSRLILISIVA